MFNKGWHSGAFTLQRRIKKEAKAKRVWAGSKPAHVQGVGSLRVKNTLQVVVFVFVLCSVTATKLSCFWQLPYHLPSLSSLFYTKQETPGSSYLLILLFCPWPFYQLWVEHLLPAVLTLAICPPLWHSCTKHITSLHHLIMATPT